MIALQLIHAMQSHKNAASFRNAGWALYEMAAALFDKTSTTGAKAHQLGSHKTSHADAKDCSDGEIDEGGSDPEEGEKDIAEPEGDEEEYEDAGVGRTTKGNHNLATPSIGAPTEAQVCHIIQAAEHVTDWPKLSTKVAGKRHCSPSPVINDAPNSAHSTPMKKVKKVKKSNPTLTMMEALISKALHKSSHSR